jgi:uncharacterized protein (TIGR03663 family)
LTAAPINAFNRTFHPDEANQAITTGRLLETGTYAYNPQDHHGPTLYYAAAAIQKAAGHNSTAELDASLLRCTPLLFAVLALVFGFLAVRRITKRTWLGILFALLLGTSPIFAFFATDFIQEMLLAAFTMMMLWSGAGYFNPGGKLKPGTWALIFGVSAGLAFATKETSILTFAAAAIAALVCRIVKVHTPQPSPLNLKTPNPAILAIAGFILTATLFYSSFGTNWQGVYNAFIAAPLSYIHRAAGSAASQGAAAHVHPWWQYLEWLFAGNEGLFAVVLALPMGLLPLFAKDSRNLLPTSCRTAFIFASIYSVALVALYSMIPYKTPWCALQILPGLVLVVTLGPFLFIRALHNTYENKLQPHHNGKRLWGKIWCCMAFLVIYGSALTCNIKEDIHINRDPDSKDIPYNYASASPQVKDLASLIIDKIASSQPPATNSNLQTPNSKLQTLNSKLQPTNFFVAVALPPEDTWPLPFYLRTIRDKVGYWTQFGELEALAGLGAKPSVVVVPAEEGHLVQPLFPHLKNTKRFEMRHRVRVRAFW